MLDLADLDRVLDLPVEIVRCGGAVLLLVLDDPPAAFWAASDEGPLIEAEMPEA